MHKPRIHNRIARSTFALPVCVLLAVGLWWLPRPAEVVSSVGGLLLVLLTAYVMAETNNVQQLVRTRSRIVASAWLFAMVCMGFSHPFHPVLFTAFCWSVAYYLLFRTYQRPQSPGLVFHLFAMLSLGGLCCPPTMWLVPLFLWHLVVFMRAMSFRGLCAALLGLLLPFWFWGGWLLWQEDAAPFLDWAASLAPDGVGRPWAALQAPLPEALAFGALSFLTLWTSVYYLRNSYDDKIRTRMMLYVCVCQSLLLVVFGLVVDVALALPLLLFSVCPLAGHYFALRTTWTALLVFVLSCAFFLALGVLTMWPAEGGLPNLKITPY